MDCCKPGSSVHGISQARIPETSPLSLPPCSVNPLPHSYANCITVWLILASGGHPPQVVQHSSPNTVWSKSYSNFHILSALTFLSSLPLSIHWFLYSESLCFFPVVQHQKFKMCWSHLLNGLPGWVSSEESTCEAGDLDSIPEERRDPGGGHGNPLRDSCLENPMDRGAWWATVRRVTKSQTRLTEQTHISLIISSLGTDHMSPTSSASSWDEHHARRQCSCGDWFAKRAFLFPADVTSAACMWVSLRSLNEIVKSMRKGKSMAEILAPLVPWSVSIH